MQETDSVGNTSRRCSGSEMLIQYSSPLLTMGMPMCCPRCGNLVTLVQDREDVPKGYAVPMIPDHDRES